MDAYWRRHEGEYFSDIVSAEPLMLLLFNIFYFQLVLFFLISQIFSFLSHLLFYKTACKINARLPI